MAQIIQANITAENGIVHIIDQVRLRHDSAIFATFVCWSTFLVFCICYTKVNLASYWPLTSEAYSGLMGLQ